MAWPRAIWNRFLQSLVRDGILKGIRGPNGGYQLARDRRGVTANDILRAAGTVDESGEELNSEFVVKVVLPVLSVAEQKFGQALSRISLDEMVQRVALNSNGTGPHDGRAATNFAKQPELLKRS
jgi:DNA-binding IscR family transcriptional regulator